MIDRQRGPTAMAAKLEDDLTDLRARLEVAETRRERKALNKRVHLLKGMLDWCKTRAGYVAPSPRLRVGLQRVRPRC